ncbi:MAG: hypothetical protein EXS05_11125 [Planctomycetaceae bacterium]|nr:hypothetical protein [Planctomycetaceae bacterium]
MTPQHGSQSFWILYSEIHAFVPHELARGLDVKEILDGYYTICSDRIHALGQNPNAGLIELIALNQSWNDLKVIQR